MTRLKRNLGSYPIIDNNFSSVSVRWSHSRYLVGKIFKSQICFRTQFFPPMLRKPNNHTKNLEHPSHWVTHQISNWVCAHRSRVWRKRAEERTSKNLKQIQERKNLSFPTIQKSILVCFYGTEKQQRSWNSFGQPKFSYDKTMSQYI